MLINFGEKQTFNHNRRRVLRMLSLSLAAVFAPAYRLAQAAVRPFHHLRNGEFRNNYIGQINNPFLEVMKWRWKMPGHPLLSFPLAENNPTFLQNNKTQPTITWIGHATVLLQIGGMNILTDPHFSDRASPFSFWGPKRGTPPGVALNDLPRVDVVLISHNHYDHLDMESIKRLAQRHPQMRVFCPLKLGGLLGEYGVRHVEELDWGQVVNWGGMRFVAEPCQHWSLRSLWGRNETLWASWAVEAAAFRFLFIGDSGYSQDFAELGKKYGGFDWAAIPIGAYEPRWFMREAHINPQEAVQIFQDLQVNSALATHWGVFSLTDEAMDEPPQKLRQAAATAGVGNFHIFMHGETRLLNNDG